MIRVRYQLTFVDMTTGTVILVRGSDRPDFRAYVPGLPVRIVCDEIVDIDDVVPPPMFAMAA